jgi:hypothetical protein
MESKRLPYLLGLIKWVNTFSLLRWVVFMLISQGVNPYFSLLVGFIATHLLFGVLVSKWIEKKYGRENLIEHNKIFKVVSMVVMIGIALYILILGQYLMFAFIVAFVLIYSLFSALILRFKMKSRKSIQEGGF